MKNIIKNFSLVALYERLFSHYGAQFWWPGETPFEVMVGAILTQNTNWNNVEKAIANLKNHDSLSPIILHRMPAEVLAEKIRPAGYFNVKARRLKNFLNWLVDKYQANMDYLKNMPLATLRKELLSINGIGPETADSILLYALEMPTFVIDVYTWRILYRHGYINVKSSYDDMKTFCEKQLPCDVKIYNEFHALLVNVGKDYCKPRPRCDKCPLNDFYKIPDFDAPP